jgi:hypothetical protein
MGYCEHDADCSGVGWAHDAALTLEQRNELGLPEGEQSMAHAKRLMRSYRKGWGAGFEQGVEQGLALSKVSVSEFIEEGGDGGSEQSTA